MPEDARISESGSGQLRPPLGFRLDPRINEVTQGFFLNTLETLEPRLLSVLGITDTSTSRIMRAPVIRKFLIRGGDARPVLARLDSMYLESLKRKTQD